VSLAGSLFSNNVADHAGGGVNDVGQSLGLGSFSLTACKLTGNSAATYGGGVYLNSLAGVTITGAVVTGNVSTNNGGGLSINFLSNAVVTGGAITGNTTGGSGGGLYLDGITGSIKGAVITGNSASLGGGVFNETTTAASVTLQIAKVFANNAPTGPDVDDTPGNLSTFKFV